MLNTKRCTNLRFTWKEALRDPHLGPVRTERSTAATVRAVAVVLYDHMNDDGVCFPSIAQIADESALHRRTVFDAIAALKQAGWVEVSRPRGRGLANSYEARVPDQIWQVLAGLGLAAETIPKGWRSATLLTPERVAVGPERVAVRHLTSGGPPPQEERKKQEDPRELETTGPGAVVSLAEWRARREPTVERIASPQSDAEASMAAVGPPPEWVWVWWWARSRGESRVFPQLQATPGPVDEELLSMPDYLLLEARWRAEGCPHQCNPRLLAGVELNLRELP